MRMTWMLKRFANIPLRKANFSTSSIRRNHFKGRDIIQTQDLTLDDWKKILWFAFDLKKAAACNSDCLNLICGKHITLLFIQQSGRNLLACTRASQLLGGSTAFYNDPKFESQTNFEDCGRALSTLTDLIIVNGCHQSILPKFADGSCVPVVSLSTNMYSILKALSFLMTIQEKFGFLNYIKLAWIGPSSPICNTILSIFPLFGISMKICCICAHGTGQMTPVTYESAMYACNKGAGEIHQVTTAAEAVYRSHVIIVNGHPEEENKVTSELIEEADFDWILLHPLPRTEVEVSDGVFQEPNNLTWQASVNHLYVAMAMMTLTMTSYEPKTKMPRFEKI